MPGVEIKVKGYQCNKCNHIWKDRKRQHDTPKPALCPSCKSPYWDLDKKK